MSRDIPDPSSEQTPHRPLGYLVFGPTDMLVQLLTRLCRQGCPQVPGAPGCSRQGASGAAETSPDIELCRENRPFLQRPDDELQNLHLLAKKSVFGSLSDLRNFSRSFFWHRNAIKETRLVHEMHHPHPKSDTHRGHVQPARAVIAPKKTPEDEKKPFFP